MDKNEYLKFANDIKFTPDSQNTENQIKNDEEKSELLKGYTKDKTNETFHSVKIDANTSDFAMYKGFFFMLISCLFRTATAISEKLLLENNTKLTAFQLNAFTVYYMFGISAFFLVLALYGTIKIELPFKKKTIWMLLLRSLLAVIVETMLVQALKFLPASNVYSVYFLYPAVVIILASSILSEKFSFMDYMCFPICIMGVFFVVKPKFLFPSGDFSGGVTSENQLLYLAAFLACFAKGTADFIIRKIKSGVHFLVIPIAFSFVGILVFPLLPLIDGIPVPDLNYIDHIRIFINGLVFFLYMTFLAYSLQFENAGRVVMVNYLQLVFLFFADLYIFHKPYQLMDLVGVLMIFGINFGNAIYKTMKRFNEKEKLLAENKNKTIV